MHERAFQALKRTILNVSGLPHHTLIKRRTIFKVIDFFYQNVYSGPETHVYSCLSSSPTIF